MRKLGLAFAAAVALGAVSILLAPSTQAQSKRLSEGFFEELRKIGAPPPPAKAAPAKPAAKPAPAKTEALKAVPAK